MDGVTSKKPNMQISAPKNFAQNMARDEKKISKNFVDKFVSKYGQACYFFGWQGIQVTGEEANRNPGGISKKVLKN